MSISQSPLPASFLSSCPAHSALSAQSGPCRGGCGRGWQDAIGGSLAGGGEGCREDVDRQHLFGIQSQRPLFPLTRWLIEPLRWRCEAETWALPSQWAAVLHAAPRPPGWIQSLLVGLWLESTQKAVLGWLGRTAACLLGSALLSGVVSSSTGFGEGHTVCDDEAWVGIPRSGDGEAG